MKISKRILTTHFSSALTSSSSALYSPQAQSNNISLYFIFSNNNNNNPQHTISLTKMHSYTLSSLETTHNTQFSRINSSAYTEFLAFFNAVSHLSTSTTTFFSVISACYSTETQPTHSTRAPFSASFVRTGADGECRRSACRRGTQQLPSAADE